MTARIAHALVDDVTPDDWSLRLDPPTIVCGSIAIRLASIEDAQVIAEKIQREHRLLTATSKQARAGLGTVPSFAEVMEYAFPPQNPDPDPPLPGAVRVDPTERDGEMVPTWTLEGGDVLVEAVKSREWECRLSTSAFGLWVRRGDLVGASYLVRRKAGA